MNKKQRQELFADLTGGQIARRTRLHMDGWRLRADIYGAVLIFNDKTGERYTGTRRTLKNGELSRRVNWD